MKAALLLLSLSCTAVQAGSLERAFEKIQNTYKKILAEQKIIMKMQVVDNGVSVAGVDKRYKAGSAIAIVGVNRALILRPEFTETVWTVILCHELGHILGGAPYTWTSPDDGGEISAEGQSDYFAAAKCLRMVWSNDIENTQTLRIMDKKTVNKVKAQGCKTDQCIRVVSAAFETLDLLYDDEKIYLDKRSMEKVESTRQDRSALPGQCRVDTYIAGAICEIPPSVPFNSSNQIDGACVSGPASRPACWFAPSDLRGVFGLGSDLQSIQESANGFESCWP